MTYTYNINDFVWIPTEKTFYADADKLFATLEDGSMHQEPFPNGKQQFYIANSNTTNRRRFTLLREEEFVEPFSHDGNEYLTWTKWIFQSEDGITCVIYKR